jgi:chemosensory pili system protein ChpA (sensor histidine kinase/response regulator)
MPAESPLVMIVDDDLDFLELTKQVLEKGGYRTACFSDPRDAFDSLAAERPDLILTDLMMESLDTGFSFSRQVKEDARFRDIPIVIITAASSQRGFDFRPTTSDDLAAMRVDAFFEKPVDPKPLLKKLEELLASHRRAKEDAP